MSTRTNTLARGVVVDAPLLSTKRKRQLWAESLPAPNGHKQGGTSATHWPATRSVQHSVLGVRW